MGNDEIKTLMSFAGRLAATFVIDGYTRDDLVQECIVAALEYRGQFDESKHGASLMTFLFNRMRGRLSRLSKGAGIVRIPEYVAVCAKRAVETSRSSGRDIDDVIGELAAESLKARHGRRKTGAGTARELSVCIRRAIFMHSVGFDVIHGRLVPQGVSCTDGSGE